MEIDIGLAEKIRIIVFEKKKKRNRSQHVVITPLIITMAQGESIVRLLTFQST